MITPKVLASGKFFPQDLVVSLHDSNRKIDSTVEGQLEPLWEAKLKQAREKGKKIYNGTSYRLNFLEESLGILKLDFGIFDYKTRECLIEAKGYYNLTEEYYRKGCHTLATVKTSDNKYLMVELSGKSMNENTIDFLGGIMETNIEMKSGKDVFESLYMELEEEGYISKNDINEAYLALVYLNANTNVGLYFEVSLNISSAELTTRFEQEHKDTDIRSLKILSRDMYLETLNKHNVNKQFVAKFVSI